VVIISPTITPTSNKQLPSPTTSLELVNVVVESSDFPISGDNPLSVDSVISPTPKYIQNLKKSYLDLGVNAVLATPFTARKLLNRINPLLPIHGRHLLHVGPIRLDWEHKRVNCQGREARLTPRLTRLLKVLMEHPREVVERESLFREVWETAYTGDTRTLDVHISWLRQAIEEDPRNPVLLRTIRGVGYRLDA
jgi:DNA-binding response OmpR family regulator